MLDTKVDYDHKCIFTLNQCHFAYHWVILGLTLGKGYPVELYASICISIMERDIKCSQLAQRLLSVYEG